MNFHLVDIEELFKLSGDALVIGIYEQRRFGPLGKKIDTFMNEALSNFLKNIGFKGEVGKIVSMPGYGQVKFKNIIVAGLGKKEKIKADIIRMAAAYSFNKAKDLNAKNLTFENLGSKILGEEAIKGVVDGAILANYEFKKYKNKKKEKKAKIEDIYLIGGKKLQKVVSPTKIAAEATNHVRDLVNEPGNILKPVDLARLAKKLANQMGLGCTIFDKNRLKVEKMQGLLAVGQGSHHPPCFIHLAHLPKEAQKRVVLLGKGITFDTGGLNIKPYVHMKTMKSDKAGACVVFGVLEAVARLNLPIEVHGLIPAAENMPGGNAFRPDDIIVFKNGKSVEIHSTDAEGRLVLADALIYGSNLKPDIMIDVATLTGACVVALGYYSSGIFSEDQGLISIFQKIGQQTGEKFWPLPLDEDLKEEIKGSFSDIKNIGSSRYGDAITAALFLKEFVSEEVKKWVHLDIAGPAFLEKPWKYYIEGATGVPVRTIISWLQKEVEK
jgi:leucyl aminopeptidase